MISYLVISPLTFLWVGGGWGGGDGDSLGGHWEVSKKNRRLEESVKKQSGRNGVKNVKIFHLRFSQKCYALWKIAKTLNAKGSENVICCTFLKEAQWGSTSKTYYSEVLAHSLNTFRLFVGIMVWFDLPLQDRSRTSGRRLLGDTKWAPPSGRWDNWTMG